MARTRMFYRSSGVFLVTGAMGSDSSSVHKADTSLSATVPVNSDIIMCARIRAGDTHTHCMDDSTSLYKNHHWDVYF